MAAHVSRHSWLSCSWADLVCWSHAAVHTLAHAHMLQLVQPANQASTPLASLLRRPPCNKQGCLMHLQHTNSRPDSPSHRDSTLFQQPGAGLPAESGDGWKAKHRVHTLGQPLLGHRICTPLSGSSCWDCPLKHPWAHDDAPLQRHRAEAWLRSKHAIRRVKSSHARA